MCGRGGYVYRRDGHVMNEVHMLSRDVMNEVHMLSQDDLLIAHLVPSDWTTL